MDKNQEGCTAFLELMRRGIEYDSQQENQTSFIFISDFCAPLIVFEIHTHVEGSNPYHSRTKCRLYRVDQLINICTNCVTGISFLTFKKSRVIVREDIRFKTTDTLIQFVSLLDRWINECLQLKIEITSVL